MVLLLIGAICALVSHFTQFWFSGFEVWGTIAAAALGGDALIWLTMFHDPDDDDEEETIGGFALKAVTLIVYGGLALIGYFAWHLNEKTAWFVICQIGSFELLGGLGYWIFELFD